MMEETGVRSSWLMATSIVAFSAAIFAGLVLVARPYFPASLPLSTAHNAQVTAGGKSEPPATAPVNARFEVVADANGIAGLTVPEWARTAAIARPGAETPALRLSGAQSNAPSYGKPGIHVALPAAFEQAASGQIVRVTVAAPRALDSPGKSFAIAYSTNDVGNSGWQRFELADHLASYSFTYQVPVMKAGYGDYVGILPGDGDAVEITAIRAEIFSAGTELPPATPLTGSAISKAAASP